MSNPIKYSTGSESLALKKGNFYIGTGDVGKGPTSSTGYYNGITPPSGGYTIYLNKATGGPSIYTCSNDAELVNLTNSIAGTSYTTANECLTYFAGQNDKMVLNRDYEGIVTDGLVLNLDAGFTPSYPKNGTTWYDVGGTNNGTLTNGPTFNSGNGGSIVFDGTNDYVNISDSNVLDFSNELTVEYVFKFDSVPSGYAYHITVKASNTGNANFVDYLLKDHGGVTLKFVANAGGVWKAVSPYSQQLNTNQWYHAIWSYNSTNGGVLRVNGVLATGGSSGTGVLATNNEPLQIGDFFYGGHNYLNGNVAFVRIYNRPLTSSEMLQNYNAQKGRFGL